MKNKNNPNLYVANRNLVYGTSSATRGASYGNMSLGSTENQTSKRNEIIMALKKTSLFEKIWYPTFIVLAILCLALIRPITFELCFAVISLILYMVANNLLAKGKFVGLIISIISATLYVVVSFFAKVYGEVIINIALYIPLDIVALITFKKNIDQKSGELEVKSLSAVGWFTFIGLSILLTGVVYILLTFIPGQIYPFLNATSIVFFLVALILRNMRLREFWWFNLVGNFITIVLWLLVATSSADLLFSLPFTLSSLAAFCNNIYGIWMWKKIYRNAKVNGSIYIKTNKVKVKNIIKVRRRYQQSLKWNLEVEQKRKEKLQKKAINKKSNG